MANPLYKMAIEIFEGGAKLITEIVQNYSTQQELNVFLEQYLILM